MAMRGWCKIPCKKVELRLDITLDCGQTFRWKEVQPGTWQGVLMGKIFTLKQTDEYLMYQLHQNTFVQEDEADITTSKKKEKSSKKGILISPDVSQVKEELIDYFQFKTNIQELYSHWCEVDSNFSHVAKHLPGVRILRQDPVENLFSFICSSNNNISRITGMVDKLCVKYGDYIGTVDAEKWYSFPSVSKLAEKKIEADLRALGFGYRAKFIHQTAKLIHEELGESWLYGLRQESYEEAHKQLLRLPGVGAKVADCVCLFSLDKPGAIPVDTHVWQIASRDYLPELRKNKSLTDKTYKEIGNFFRKRFGTHAGWAHSVLFSADLKKFQAVKVDLKKDMSSEKAGNPKKQKKK